jgi:hypothetical protein
MHVLIFQFEINSPVQIHLNFKTKGVKTLNGLIVYSHKPYSGQSYLKGVFIQLDYV